MKPRFPIPLQRVSLEKEGTSEMFRADTTVLDLLRSTSSSLYRVVPIEDRRHVTPKLYRVELQSYWGKRWQPWEDIRPCRLGNLPIGSLCLVEVPVSGQIHLVCEDDRGLHLVQQDNDSGRCLLCEDDSRQVRSELRRLYVTCRSCLKHKTTWLIYRVLPYEHPEVTEKRRRKDQNKARIRARYPTAFDRILNDPFED